jgi:nitrogen fixation NifU-like protein
VTGQSKENNITSYSEDGPVMSELTAEHACHPRNTGMLPDASGYGEATLACGDTLRAWLKIDHGVVTGACFMTENGCDTTVASGSMATEMVKGKTVSQVAHLKPQDIIKALEGTTVESVHGALLATHAIHEAVKDYLKYKNEPWKRAYGRF